MRLQFLIIYALQTVSALTPRGAAKDPARGRENVGVLSCGTQLGATTYGYLQRLKGLWASGLKEPVALLKDCLLYTSPSPRDRTRSRMPSSA